MNVETIYSPYKMRKLTNPPNPMVKSYFAENQKKKIVRRPTKGRKGKFQFTPVQKELKFFDTAVSFNVDATGEVPATGQLNIIPQGVTPSARVGQRCVVKSIYIRGSAVFTPSAAATEYEITTIWIVLDSQCNQAAATFADVFTGTNASTCVNNLANSKRFTILKKFVLVWNALAGVTTAYNPLIQALEFYTKCNIPITWTNADTTGVVANTTANNIFLLAGTTGTTDDLVSVTATARLRFSDE